MSYNDILDIFYNELGTDKDKSEDLELIYKDSQYSYFKVYTYKGILSIGSPTWCLKTKSHWENYHTKYPNQWVVIDNRYIKSIITPDNKIIETFDSIEIIANSVDSNKIIGDTIDTINIIRDTIELEGLEIAKNDFSEEMIWEDAKKVCVSLGNGWRLPNKDELNTIYLNKDKIGRFASFSYWSSTDAGESYAWLQDFANGYQSYDGKNITFYVRAVRTIK